MADRETDPRPNGKKHDEESSVICRHERYERRQSEVKNNPMRRRTGEIDFMKFLD